MTAPGWHTDPTGRFGQRWHDGTDWTDTVIGANGQQMNDLMPRALTPADLSWQPDQAWQPAAALRPPVVVSTAWQPTVAPVSQTVSNGLDLVALIGGLAGAVLIALGLFVLDWGPTVSYSDVRERLADATDLDGVDSLLKAYTQWLGYAWTALALGLVAFTVLWRASGSTAHRLRHVIAAVVTGTGAILATFVVVRVFRGEGPDPEFGAWLAAGGYLAMLAAVVVSARRDPA